MKPNWTDARELYRDLAIPGFYMAFEDWFTSRIQGEYKINKDWIVEGEGDNLEFRITQEVADQVAHEERGVPIIRLRDPMSEEVAGRGWNQDNNPQTHAITGDDEL